MKTAIVTGACGLVGAAAVELLIEEGYKVVGLDNDMRRYFFGADASTAQRGDELQKKYPRFKLITCDVRKGPEVDLIFADWDHPKVELVVHTAAQPSHDWAALEPQVDFGVNALGTLNLLEAARRHFPFATFAHISTSKVYGDNPNLLPFSDRGTRIDLSSEHRWYEGIDTSMSVEGKECLHSLFGVSKLAGDLLVQEYGRYFGMPTVCFRPGCVTGPGHAGAELHGFLSYLVKCIINGRPYHVYGYEGKQVRCNIYAKDLAAACLEFHLDPRAGAVYNIGGGRRNACSVLEAIDMAECITHRKLAHDYSATARRGDHMWWISSNREFERDYPRWQQTRTLDMMVEEIAAAA